MLPLVPEAVYPPPSAPRFAPALADGHVLVVDDEHGVRQGMRTLLESLGMRVTLAEGEFDARDAARHDRPDLASPRSHH